MIEDVSKAKVGDILETLKKDHREHALVMDKQGKNNELTIRGIFSIYRIARQLGLGISLDEKESLAGIAHHILNR